MDIGLTKERQTGEARVALTPAAVHTLMEDGHRVYVESGAGGRAGFSDEEYRTAGGQIVYHREEAIRRCEIAAMVAPPRVDDFELFENDQVVYAFLLLAVQPREVIDGLVARRMTAVGMEMIQQEDDRAPIQQAMSEIGGPLAVQMATRFLQTSERGRGILLGGLPGVAPAHVIILGGGTVGWAASRSALGLGAQVTVFDINPEVLRSLHDQFGGRAVTRFAHTRLLRQAIPTADVLIGAAAVHGRRAPALIDRHLVTRMKPGSVIVDVAIDMGGCVETSRPTTTDHPAYVEEEVIHCCIPNLPALVARTASYVLANASLPYLRRLASLGVKRAIEADPALARSVYVYRGRIEHPLIEDRLKIAGAPGSSGKEHG
jgi:alanine dehydrogenase